MATEKSENKALYLNNYKFETLTYPEDLSVNPAFSGNKVVFFINVASASKITQAGAANKKYELWEIPESDQVKVTGQETAQAVQESTGTDIIATKMMRLSSAIALYIPNSLIQGTTVSWDEEDMSSVAGEMLDAATKGATQDNPNTPEADTKGFWSTVGDTAKAGAESASAKVLANMKKTQRIARVTPGNSKKELLFSAVNFRSFDFNYQFTPKSESEAENVMNIIRMFKHHMLPEFANETKSIYIYPSEFNVKYYKGDTENQYIEKQMTAVLEGVNVDYTPNGQFNTFANGMPQQINLSLRFKELSMPSKETSPYDGHGV